MKIDSLKNLSDNFEKKIFLEKALKEVRKRLEEITDKFLEKMKEAEAEEKVYKSEKNNALTGYSSPLVSELGDLKKEMWKIISEKRKTEEELEKLY